MSLEPPNLDDRRFQDLVDDAMRLARDRLPEWSPSSPSDPGVALIEVFAWMTDQLIYRLNRVPDRLHVKFLELMGIKLIPPTSARTVVTFWLSAPSLVTVNVPIGTRASTVGSDDGPAVVFSTEENLAIVPSSVHRVLSIQSDGANARDRTESLLAGREFECFQSVPVAGDSVLIGLTNAVPSCSIALDISCKIQGVGVDPVYPPLIWEVWTGEDWLPCLVDRDETGGLNYDGRIVLDVPRAHLPDVMHGARAGWLRARVMEDDPGQPAYSSSPLIRGLAVSTIGGWTSAIHADMSEGEVLGIAKGIPGARFTLNHRPVVRGLEPFVVEVDDGDTTTIWSEVPDFASSGPGDPHFVLDAASGEVSFGPAVRLADGSIRVFGEVPPRGAEIRLPLYHTGGGSRGNVLPGTVTVLVDKIAGVDRVENRRGAFGGLEGEDIESAKVRGPLRLRIGGRAVTAEDFELITRDAAPEIARVRCTPGTDGQNLVRVLVVPAVPTDDLQFSFEALVPSDQSLETIAERLDKARIIGTRIVVEPPAFRGITVAAKVRAAPRVNRLRVRDDALRALYRMFHPVVGGPDGTGWPFGRTVRVSDIHATLQGVAGTEMVEEIRLFGADPITGQRGSATEYLQVEPDALVYSYLHQVTVA